MKIISLNTYGGTLFQPMMSFVEQHQSNTDIFCFQEILTTNQNELLTTPGGNRANLFQELCKRLPEFTGHFLGMLDDVDTSFITVPGTVFGLAIFVRNAHNVTDYRELSILNSRQNFDPTNGETTPVVAQALELHVNDHRLTVFNVHGTYFPAHKRDTPQRLEQSRTIIDFLKDRSGEKIVMGDFNLLPDTESIRMFAQAGYRNLIDDHQIPTTRGSICRQLHPEFATGKYGFQEFADYTFVTPGINVKSFDVPDAPISDHLPMILEIAEL